MKIISRPATVGLQFFLRSGCDCCEYSVQQAKYMSYHWVSAPLHTVLLSQALHVPVMCRPCIVLGQHTWRARPSTPQERAPPQPPSQPSPTWETWEPGMEQWQGCDEKLGEESWNQWNGKTNLSFVLDGGKKKVYHGLDGESAKCTNSWPAASQKRHTVYRNLRS